MSEKDQASRTCGVSPQPQVFISYSTEDKSVAEAVCAGLESRGFPCWIAPRDVRPGQNWGGSIVKSIAAARVMVLVFSRHTNSSRHVMNEIERAVSHRVTIIPFRIEKVQPSEDLELFISSCHWLDAFTPPLEAKIADLVTAVGAAIGHETKPAAAVVGPVSPSVPTAPVRDRKNTRTLALAGAAVVAVSLVAALVVFVLGSRGDREVAAKASAVVSEEKTEGEVESWPSQPATTARSEDLTAQAESSEEEQDFVGALEAYGLLLARDPAQSSIRMRASNAIARLLEEVDAHKGDERLIAAVRSVANANVPAAQNFLGILLRTSDPQESLSMFKRAGEQGVARAMAEAGLMISNGDGAPVDMVEAAKWLKRSADAGYPEGMLLYAECLLTGKGTEINERAAAALYSEAAASGSAAAKSHLARMYQHGVGVPAADPKKAFELYEEAAAQGFVEAQGRLGALYMSGEAGPQSAEKAVQLWEDGAAKGDTVCMLFFAISLESGALAPPNKPEATFWYKKAAQAGNPDAQNWCVQNRVDF